MSNEFHISRHTLILSDYSGLNYGKNLEDTENLSQHTAFMTYSDSDMKIVHREFFVDQYQVNVAYVIDCTDEKWEDILKCLKLWERENRTSAVSD